MDPMKYIMRATAKIESTLFPDVCTIETVSGTPVRSPNGVVTTPKVMREYKGSTDIPCRLDTSRSFKPEKLPAQEINANEYILHLPVEVIVKPNDIIAVNGTSALFEVRKMNAISSWRVTNEALIVALEGQYD